MLYHHNAELNALAILGIDRLIYNKGLDLRGVITLRCNNTLEMARTFLLTSVGQDFGAQVLNPAVVAAKSPSKIFFQVVFLSRTELYNRETKVKSSSQCSPVLPEEIWPSGQKSGLFPSSKRVKETPCMFGDWFWVWYLTA